MPPLPKHISLSAISAAFALAAAVVCSSHPAEAHIRHHHHDFNQTSIDAESSEDLNTDSHSIIHMMMHKYEGRACVDDDNGHGVSCWGIVASANNLTEQQDRALTEDDAETIYKIKYWDKIGGDNLDPKIRHLAFNDAIQFGQKNAIKMIAQANNDPYVLLQENSVFYERLGQSRRYQGSLQGWRNRQDRLLRLQNRISSETISLASIDAQQQAQATTTAITPVAARSALPASAPQVTQVVMPVDTHTESSPTPANKGTGFLLSIFMMTMARRRNRHGTMPLPPIDIDSDEPMFNLTPIKKLMSHAMGNPSTDDNLAPDNLIFGSMASRSNYLSPYGFHSLEHEAFKKIFETNNPQLYHQPHSWRVDYPNESHVIVQHGHVHMYGDGGIEDSLKFAALAWGHQCKLTGGTVEEREKVRAAAQKLVDEGTIAEGFTITGLGSFSKTPLTAALANEEQPYRLPSFLEVANINSKQISWPIAANG